MRQMGQMGDMYCSFWACHFHAVGVLLIDVPFCGISNTKKTPVCMKIMPIFLLADSEVTVRVWHDMSGAMVVADSNSTGDPQERGE